MSTPRLLSGIQPTGELHLGNYLGAMVQWRKMYRDIPSIFSVVDLHALTLKQDPEKLRKATMSVVASILAAGIDPQQAIIFRQSDNQSIPRLQWLFMCVARIGWLNRMTQFKDKAGKNREKASVGLYAYPVLMAADILAFHTTHVPVGEDQKQHLEFTRDVAQKFNIDYAHEDFFSLPEPYILATTGRIMSLRDGSKKMSKSDPSDASRINLHDDADTIASKIRRAKTGVVLPHSVAELDAHPEARNLLNLHAVLSESTLEKSLNDFSSKGFASLKDSLTGLLLAHLDPVRRRMQELEGDQDYLEEVLRIGGERAQAISEPVVKKAYNLCGLSY